jgi:hypothetical protein
MSARSSETSMPGTPRATSPSANMFASSKSSPETGRMRAWCERHMPTLSRRFLVYGRDYPLGLVFSLLAVYAFGRWWAWFHRAGPPVTALASTAAAAVPLVLARRRFFVAACPFAWIAGQSYLHLLLEGNREYFLVGTLSTVVGVVLFALGMRAGERRNG